MRPRAPVLAEGLLLAALLALQGVLFSRGLDTATNYDEGVYLASLDALRHGQTLGADVFASQPPGFYGLLRIVAFLFGDSVEAMHGGMLALALVGSLAGFSLGRMLLGPAAGLAAAALLAVAPPYATEATKVAADTPAVVLALVALALAARSFRPGAPLPLAFLAGAALAAAVSVKLLAATAVVPLVALAVSRRASRRSLVALLLGFLALAVALVAAYAGSLGEIWDGAVRFHQRARAIGGPGIGDNADRLGRFFDFRTPFAWLLPAGAAAWALVARRVWPLWLWAAASAGFLVWTKPLFDHHFVLLAAALALPAGAALGALAARARRPLVLPAAALLLAFLGAGYAQERRRLARNDLPEPASVTWAAAQLKGRTRPNALVAGDLPIVAYLAGRRLPGALVDTSYVRLATGSLTPARILRLIDRDRVGAVVVGRTFAHEPEILEGLRARFDRRRRYGDVTIYLRSAPAPRASPRAEPASGRG